MDLRREKARSCMTIASSQRQISNWRKTGDIGSTTDFGTGIKDGPRAELTDLKTDTDQKRRASDGQRGTRNGA